MTVPIQTDENSHRKYVALLAVIAAAILGLGILLRPEKKPTQVTVSEAEKARLWKMTQKKSLEDMTAYFAGIAREAAAHLVWLDGAKSSGVIWNEEGLIVTTEPNGRLPQSLEVLSAGGAGKIRVEAAVSSQDLSVTALQAPQDAGLRAVQKGAGRILQAGAWVVQVSLRENGEYLFIPGVYSGTASASCGEFQYQEVGTNLPLRESMLGGGLFDADGNLLGMVLACNERYVAVATDSVQAAIDRASAFEGRLLHRYGIRVGELDEASQAYFRAKEGVLITEVCKGGPADTAGLNPGDVIVGLDDEAVRSPEDLTRLLLPAVSPNFNLKVRRGPRVVEITLPPGDLELTGSGDSEGSGIVLKPPPEGIVVDAVEPGSRADHAGIEPGDRLLEAGGRRLADLRTARKVLSTNNQSPTFVVVERGSKKLGLLLK